MVCVLVRVRVSSVQVGAPHSRSINSTVVLLGSQPRVMRRPRQRSGSEGRSCQCSERGPDLFNACSAVHDETATPFNPKPWPVFLPTKRAIPHQLIISPFRFYLTRPGLKAVKISRATANVVPTEIKTCWTRDCGRDATLGGVLS